ncbi:hypothetical protein L218DRAFT_967666, partial [Marasmius fiardii PR-910]
MISPFHLSIFNVLFSTASLSFRLCTICTWLLSWRSLIHAATLCPINDNIRGRFAVAYPKNTVSSLGVCPSILGEAQCNALWPFLISPFESYTAVHLFLRFTSRFGKCSLSISNFEL